MSTRAQLRTALKRRVARPDLTDADFDKYLDDGLMDLATIRMTFRSLEYEGAPISTSLGVPSYPIESNFFSISYIEDTTNKRVLERFDGGFREYLDSKQNAQNGKPTRFVEFGSNFYVLDPPEGIFVLVPYGFRRPAFNPPTGDSGMPNIEVEWHYAIELVAATHALRDVGDEERAIAIDTEFDKWATKRDTPVRQAARHNNPPRMLRVHGGYFNPRTGV